MELWWAWGIGNNEWAGVRSPFAGKEKAIGYCGYIYFQVESEGLLTVEHCAIAGGSHGPHRICSTAPNLIGNGFRGLRFYG